MKRPVEELTEAVASIMARHSLKPVEMAAGVMRVASVLFMRAQSANGGDTRAKEFCKFAKATYLVFWDEIKAAQAARPS